MPRISAASVAAHVAQQEDAVVRAAGRLFSERGVDAVSLGDIAAEVGLARNSLYRYFPDKEHLFAVWVRREIAPLRDASDEIAGRDEPALERLDAWLTLQLDYLAAPEHQAMARATGEVGALPPDVADDVEEGHRALNSALERIVSDALTPVGAARGRSRGRAGARDPRVLAALIAGALRSAATLVAHGATRKTVLSELVRAARAIVS
jgi:AcrR family transcriptional regulator